jgi:hypothetical protein
MLQAMPRVSVALLAVLFAIAAAAPAAGAPTLQLGATGTAVHELQDTLARVR